MQHLNKVINMECKQGMRVMIADNSIDAIVTDPPYGLSKQPKMEEVLKHWLAGDDYQATGSGFMGKTWDSFVPGPSIWKEAYRCLKPGAWAVVFAGSRTQDLMTLSLRLAGFEIMDTGMWLYGSGFPKSLDISKAIDKLNGRPSIPDDEFRRYIKSAMKLKSISNKILDSLCGTNGMVGHYTGESQPTFPTVEKWKIIKRVLELDDRYDEVISRVEADREVVGTKIKARSTSGNSALPTIDGETVYKEFKITKPATDQAKQWEGFGTALKPAYEPFILARKPLDGTYANNVLKHGVGGLNIDGCRIPSEEGGRPLREVAPLRDDFTYTGNALNGRVNGSLASSKASGLTDQGRFPANVIHDGLDEPWAKYFYCAKTSKKDRNEGLENLAVTSAGDMTGGREECSDGLNSPRAGAGRTTGARNIHPTVKPTELMRYLCRLVTPPEGLILDPFSGSGSTGKAAVLEGFNFIGFEMDEKYCEIANHRINHKLKEINNEKN